MVHSFGDVTVSQTSFVENSGGNGGAVAISGHSLLVISNCSFSRNVAPGKQIGKIVGNKKFGGGGAISILWSVLEIFHSHFDNNFAILNGGGVFSDQSSLLIHDSVFQNNIAILLEGAILIANQSSLVIKDSSLKNNSIHYDTLYGGGGLSILINSTAKIMAFCFFENKGAIFVTKNSQVSIFHTSFVNNTGLTICATLNVSLQMDHCRGINNSGLAVLVVSSSINVTNAKFSHSTEGALSIQQSSKVSFCNCSFTDNFALKGGVLTAFNSHVQFIACKFIGNSTTNGGVFSISGNFLLKNCEVINNSANADGGVGYLEENSQINIKSSIFKENSALGLGGVFWMKTSNATVWNSSFVNNSAGTNGGVIYAEYFSFINVSQTTCYGNKASTSGVLYATATKVFVNDSIIEQNSAGICGAISIDTASVFEMNFCQVNRNKAGAFCTSNSSLFISRSSVFKGNTPMGTIQTPGTLCTSIELYNSMGYLENCTFLVESITFTESELRLSHTVFLQNVVQKVVEIRSVNFMHTFINRLYTYKSLMRHGNKILKSNATDFKQIAIKAHFIREINGNYQNNFTVTETQFSSSKFSVSKSFSFSYRTLSHTF